MLDGIESKFDGAEGFDVKSGGKGKRKKCFHVNKRLDHAKRKGLE
jgi:hypothetical protein